MERADGETVEEGMMMIPTSAAGGGDGGESLPSDAVVEILLRLPVKSLLRFRCVCKPWCSLTSDPIFVNKHHQIAASTTTTLFSSLGPGGLHDVGGSEITDRTLPPHTKDPLLRHTLSNSVDGLVCGFRGGGDSIFLLNLATGEAVQLPPPTKSYVESVGLGFDASAGTYKLLRFFGPAVTHGVYECEAFTVSPNQKWRYLAPVTSPPSSLCELIYFNGFIHWIDRKNTPGAVVAFDCKDEILSTIPITESARFKQAQPVSFKGHLCFAAIYNSCLKIMMLEDYARPEWTTLFVINCTFLLDESPDLMIIGIQRGKVLFQDVSWKLITENKFTIYSYDLHNKVWSKMAYIKPGIGLGLYTESLISPRRLLNLQGE